MLAGELDDYVVMVTEAQQQFSVLHIKLGLEVDFIPGHERWVQTMADKYEWDYFIGSVHYVSGNWDFDNPAKLDQWNDRDPYDVWADYFQRLTNAAASGLFQIIGHADLPKKFGHRPEQDCTALFTDFLTACADTETCIELNTAGLRKDCAEIYPSLQVLQLAQKRGVQITFGSDAHAPKEVGMNFGDAISLAKEAGFTKSCRFEKRQATSFAI